MEQRGSPIAVRWSPVGGASHSMRPLQASDEQTHDAVNFGDQAKLIGIGVRDVLLERLGEPVPARNLKGSCVKGVVVPPNVHPYLGAAFTVSRPRETNPRVGRHEATVPTTSGFAPNRRDRPR